MKFEEIIPVSIFDLNNLFKSKNKKLYLVGGCIRDFLIGSNPKDFDLATDALPEEVLLICKNYKTNEVGKSFGVVSVCTEDQPKGIEIATFRNDIYNDKLGETRNPDVIFSTIEEDVLRRDITCSGLFYDIQNHEIIDLVGGIDDINNKIIKFIGDGNLRIKEDPLRIMRSIRFSCRYGFSIEQNSQNAIIQNKNKLSIITAERIFEEINKSFTQSMDFSIYMKYLVDFEIVDVIFPNITLNKVEKFQKFSCIEMYFSALFLGNNTKILFNTMKERFKMTHNFTRKVIFLLDVLNVTAENVLSLYDKKLVSETTNEEIKKWFDFIEEISNKLPKSVKVFTNFTPSVKAINLMSIGLTGKELGDEIRKLEMKNYLNLML